MYNDSTLTDAHTHLDNFSDGDRGEVISKAKRTGVKWIITSGMDVESSHRAVEIADENECVFSSVGIHPWVAAETNRKISWEKLNRYSKDKKNVAIGEVGLDFVDNAFTGESFHDQEELCNLQVERFRKQIKLARDLKLPLIIHCRGGYEKLIEILNREAGDYGGLIHDFDGKTDQALSLIDIGFYLSFGGQITYPEATKIREIVDIVPVDRILLETDSPYMPIYNQENEENEPANVKEIATKISQIKGMDYSKLASLTLMNFETLFNL